MISARMEFGMVATARVFPGKTGLRNRFNGIELV